MREGYDHNSKGHSAGEGAGGGVSFPHETKKSSNFMTVHRTKTVIANLPVWGTFGVAAAPPPPPPALMKPYIVWLTCLIMLITHFL